MSKELERCKKILRALSKNERHRFHKAEWAVAEIMRLFCQQEHVIKNAKIDPTLELEINRITETVKMRLTLISEACRLRGFQEMLNNYEEI